MNEIGQIREENILSENIEERILENTKKKFLMSTVILCQMNFHLTFDDVIEAEITMFDYRPINNCQIVTVPR